MPFPPDLLELWSVTKRTTATTHSGMLNQLQLLTSSVIITESIWKYEDSMNGLVGRQCDYVSAADILSCSNGTNVYITVHLWHIIIIIIIIIIGIQPLGRSGQRPEFSQATGMALVWTGVVLVCCILGKFLGVACHCFPPLFRCSHFSPPGASTSDTTWEIQAAEVGTVGENVVR